ncbi:MAG: 4Fe-4S dicluster domain-containing protein [Chloroflexota bacterium]
MAHQTVRSGYAQFVDRLNMFPQGAPPSDLLFAILKMLCSEREARLLSRLPIKPFTLATASRLWQLSPVEAGRVLDALADRALLLDIEQEGERTYVLPPPMAGFFEFSLMRVRADVDQQALSELFYQYLTVEGDFMAALFTGGETQPGRAFVHEPALGTDDALYVLDYERASAVIADASDMAVGLCYCRHKMQHLGRACGAPLDICMTFGGCADSLIRHGFARRVDKTEGLDLLRQAWESGLVQFGENARQGVSFICNCCGCCCEAMIAARRFAVLRPIHTTNFLPRVDEAACLGCGRCVNACPVEAMALVSANDPQRGAARRARLDAETCLGCGVCVRACRTGALSLVARERRVITPANGAHRIVLMAIERGKLQHLIFDQQALASHRALAAILGAILRLPPLKQALASRQLKSRYLEALLARAKV